MFSTKICCLKLYYKRYQLSFMAYMHSCWLKWFCENYQATSIDTVEHTMLASVYI